MNTPLPIVPLKSFGVAKRRLAPVLDAAGRSLVGRAIALRTLRMLAQGVSDPIVVTADADVERWADAHGFRVLAEPAAGGLDAAAAVGAGFARERDRPWLIVHADLPMASDVDFAAAAAAMASGSVITPSRDGGTNILGDRGAFVFAYGRGSFHRHLQRLTQPVIVNPVPALVTDLDAPVDFEAILASPAGSWLRDELDF